MRKALEVFASIFVVVVMVAGIISAAQGQELLGYKMFGVCRSLWNEDLAILGKVLAVAAAIMEAPFVIAIGPPSLLVNGLHLSRGQGEVVVFVYIALFVLFAWAYPGDERQPVTVNSLPDMRSLYEALGLKPIFGLRSLPVRKGKCFYVGPFAEPFSGIFSNNLKPALERAGFSVFRADDIFTTGVIMEDVWESINTCELLVADITGRNPNALYEIGMAHAIGKRVVLITQEIEDVPFDLRHYRIISYADSPEGHERLEESLVKTATAETAL